MATLAKLFPRNEHVVDRVIRVALGVGVLALLGVGPVPGWGLVGLLGLVPLATGVIGSCPVYTVAGFSTCSLKSTT